MRLFEAPSTLLSFVTLLLSSAQTTSAGPLSRITELVQHEIEKLSHAGDALSLQNSTLELKKRQGCAAGSFACGYYGQVCCVTGSQTCATNAQDQAICVASGGSSAVTAAAGGGGGNGQWQLYTSVWTTTGAITMTSVYSSFIPAAATGSSSGNCVPNWANNESPCGARCCASGQYCFDPQAAICKPAGNGGFTTTGVVAGIPPVRPTTINGVLTTITMTPTTTVPFGTPIATGQNGTLIPANGGGGGGGLSGGAIAGIVIGVIAGIILLILICLCCCAKAGLDAILALFGIGKKKKRSRVEETYIEEHRHGRYGSAAGSGRHWYGSAAGGRPGRPPPPPKEKKSGLGGLGAMGLGLGGLAIALGLKRRHDRKHDEKSDVSSDYYGSSYYSYGSSSSGGRTRRTSRSRR